MIPRTTVFAEIITELIAPKTNIAIVFITNTYEWVPINLSLIPILNNPLIDFKEDILIFVTLTVNEF